MKKLLERYKASDGLWYYMPVQTGYGRHGVPDFMVLFKGHLLALECKSANGSLTVLQVQILDEIRHAGGLPLVITPSDIENLAAHLRMIATL